MDKPTDTVSAAVPSSVDEELVRSIFETYGDIKSCSLSKGPKPLAVVKFASVDEAAFCVENLNGQPLFEDAGNLVITFHRPQVPKAAAKATAKPAAVASEPGKKPAVKAPVLRPASTAPAPMTLVRPATAGLTPGRLPGIRPQAPVAAGATGVIRKPKTAPIVPQVQGVKATALKSTTGVIRPGLQASGVQRPFAGIARAAVGPYGGAGVAKPVAPFNGKAAAAGGAAPSISALKRELTDCGAIVGGTPKEWDLQGELFIGGLPPDTTDLELYEIFAPFGAIPLKGVKAMRKGDACTGIGFVNFLSPNDAQNAIHHLDGHQMANGKALKVKVKSDRS